MTEAYAIFFAIVVGMNASPSSVEFTNDSLEVVKANVVAKKAVLVDVRSLAEWKRGHIEGSIFLPVDSLTKDVDAKALAKKLPKDKILYTFCVVGMRAKVAAEVLVQHGYTVRALQPGYEDLLKAGFKKAKTAAAPDADHANSRQWNAG
jgi:rhodanese-related sulfurtransferase